MSSSEKPKSSLLAGLERMVSFGANLAALFGLLAAIYAFIFPDKVARAVVDFQDLVQDTRNGLASISDSAKTTAENTLGTQLNTRKIADAIPYWLKFDIPPLEDGNPMSGLYTIISLENPSPYKIDVRIKAYSESRLLKDQHLTIMPRESDDFSVKDWHPEITYCLEGRSAGLGDGSFYEYRAYKKSELMEALQSLEPIPGCEL